MLKITSLALLALNVQAIFDDVDSTGLTDKVNDVVDDVNDKVDDKVDDVNDVVDYVSDAGAKEESKDKAGDKVELNATGRIDASTEIVGDSSKTEATISGVGDESAMSFKIQAIIRLYEASKTLYDEAMKQHLNNVYSGFDKDGKAGLSSDEALNYLYEVLDVTRQQDGLSIAKAAAEIASGDDDEVVDKSEMENFLYKLFTGDYSGRIYSKSDLGINIDLDTYNK